MCVESKQEGRAARPGCGCPSCQRDPNSPTSAEHRSINLLVALADERSRRLLVGFLAEQRGHGGITLMSRITGLDRDTVARGARELHEDVALPPGRIRRPGAGRKRVEIAAPGS
jgi:hypothetical protein